MFRRHSLRDLIFGPGLLRLARPSAPADSALPSHTTFPAVVSAYSVAEKKKKG